MYKIATLPRKSNNRYAEEISVITSLCTILMIQKQPKYIWHKGGGDRKKGFDG